MLSHCYLGYLPEILLNIPDLVFRFLNDINLFIIPTNEKEGKGKIVPNHWIQKILRGKPKFSLLPPPVRVLLPNKKTIKVFSLAI